MYEYLFNQIQCKFKLKKKTILLFIKAFIRSSSPYYLTSYPLKNKHTFLNFCLLDEIIKKQENNL